MRRCELIAAVCAALALGGCATSITDPTSRVEQLYQQSTGITPASASCPSDIPIAKGHQFTCTLSVRGERRSVTVMEMTANSSGSTIQIVSGN